MPASGRVIEAACIILYIAFIMSAFSAVACLIMIEWLRSIEGEADEFILQALSTNKPLLKLPPQISFASINLLVVVLNMQVHVYYTRHAAVTVNVICFCFGAFSMMLFYHFTMRRQSFRTANNGVVMRHLYSNAHFAGAKKGK